MFKKAIITLFILSSLTGIVFITAKLSDERVSTFWQIGRDRAPEEDVSILVLGRVAEGQGGRWHAAPNLVDAIVLINYSPEAEVINLVSLPRDLYGSFGDEKFKINEIYSRKKIDSLLEKLPEITGIETDKFLVVDAGIIERVTDELGGIDIFIEETVTDPVSGYRLEEGEQHLNGEDVVWLIRNRYSPQGDFFREKNQQVVIEGIFEKFSELGSPQKVSFLFSLVPEVKNAESNFNLGEIIPKFDNLESLRFNGVVLDFSTGLLSSSYVPIGGSAATSAPLQDSLGQADATNTASSTGTTSTVVSAYTLIPAEGIDNYTEIRQFITDRIK